MAADPQTGPERKLAARHLVQHPLTCKEHDPDLFRLIRRHEADLDRWFTQRLGYRLHVDADSARLFKTTVVPDRRPLRTAAGRPLGQLEHVLLALVLASTAAGPAVISLRDLVDQVRSAAAEADIELGDRPSDRRALVAALQWMIAQGLATELHARVDAYAGDEGADAVLRVRPDRISLVPLPALVAAGSTGELLARAERRSATRQWMRCRLVEDPVLYREDLTDAEWGELRRRLGDEERLLEEMFGLVLEGRSEGVAAVDPAGTLSDQRFPAGGTVGHAALLLVEALRAGDEGAGDVAVAWSEVRGLVAGLADRHRRRWANDLVESPERLTRQVVALLVDLRLARLDRPEAVARGSDDVAADHGTTAGDDADLEGPVLRLLPAAGRFLAQVSVDGEAVDEGAQEALW